MQEEISRKLDFLERSRETKPVEMAITILVLNSTWSKITPGSYFHPDTVTQNLKKMQYEMRVCKKSRNKVTKTVYVLFEFLWIRCYIAQIL